MEQGEDVKEDNEKQVCHMRFIVENHTKVNNTPIQDSWAQFLISQNTPEHILDS